MIETNFKVRSFDEKIPLEEFRRRERSGIHVILDNLRSAFNVGSIFRTSDSALVSKVYACGITAYPPHRKLEKTAMGATGYVPWEHFPDVTEAVRRVKEAGIRVYSLETTSISTSYAAVKYTPPVCLVLGNEALGVSEPVLKMSDEIIQIPMKGYKNSINVAAAFGLVVFEILRQWEAL